jgi:hypothetical protein
VKQRRYNPRGCGKLTGGKKRPVSAPAVEIRTVEWPARIHPIEGYEVCNAKTEVFRITGKVSRAAYEAALADLEFENRHWADCVAHLTKEAGR